MPHTTQQKRLLSLAEKGGNNATLFLLDEIHTLESMFEKIQNEIKNRIAELKSEISDMKEVFRTAPLDKVLSDEAKIERLAMRLATKIATMEKGDKGERGERGERGEKGIGCMGEKGAKGERGDTLTRKNSRRRYASAERGPTFESTGGLSGVPGTLPHPPGV